jgi:UDP-N-acetylglucosamine 2-epimerase (non-hydrolysing)
MDSVVFVAGARPNFMKIAPILRATRSAPFRSILVHTGQHYDHAMSGVFFEQLGIPAPDVHLNVGSGQHGAQTARIMAAFEEYLVGLPAKPRGLVVVGDVNSTMACALVAAKRQVPIAHVEAGLRSFDRAMPEEINRIVTDAVSDVLLVSEPAGTENLAREGVASERIHYVGNVMIDSLVWELPRARALAMPSRLGLVECEYVIVTLHRPSNVDDDQRLRRWMDVLQDLAQQRTVLFPAHPRTRARLDSLGLIDTKRTGGVRVVEPLAYREFIGLLDRCQFVLTDSGGIQEEATFLGVPCITLRANTERPVTVAAGTNHLVGEDPMTVSVRMIQDAVQSVRTPTAISGWDGQAAQRVVQVLETSWFGATHAH